MEKLIIFTDGACSGNGKNYAKAGIGIYFPNNEFNNISKEFTELPITNQRAELCAIQMALDLIKDRSKDYKEVVIYSDSRYSIKSVTEWIKNWEKNDWKNANGKPVKNLDIIRPISRALKNYSGKISFTHVRSHTGQQTFECLGNAKADELATGAVKKLK